MREKRDDARTEQDDADQRFERTVRNLLRTPPKPHETKKPAAKQNLHKGQKDAKPKRKP
jgi:hypothetical protein